MTPSTPCNDSHLPCRLSSFRKMSALEIDLVLRNDLSMRARRMLFKESPVNRYFIRSLLAELLRRGSFDDNRRRRLLGRVLQKANDPEAQRRLLATARNFALLFKTEQQHHQQQHHQQQQQEEVIVDWTDYFNPPPPPPSTPQPLPHQEQLQSQVIAP